MSRNRYTAAIATCVLALALTACGSDSDDADPGPSSSSGSADSDAPPAADASTGDPITGEGFTFNAPDGWKEGDSDAVPSVKILAVAVDPDDDDGFADNANVLEDPTIVGADAEELEKGVSAALSNVATDIRIGDSLEVDGDPAVVVLATYPKYHTVQHAVEHDGKGYIATYSFSSDVSEDDQLALAASVAASWKWAS